MLLTVLGIILMAISGYIYLLTGGNTDFTFAATVITFGAGLSCIYAFAMKRMDYQFGYKTYLIYSNKFTSALERWEKEKGHFEYLMMISNTEDSDFVKEFEATKKRLESSRRKVLNISDDILQISKQLFISSYLTQRQREQSLQGYEKAYDFIRKNGDLAA